jgi:chromosome segregation ATPase
MEAPSNDFVNKPLDEVRARRDQLQTQRDELETNLNDAMKKGMMGGLQVTAASTEINEFQRKIDEANQVLQSGQVKTRPTEDTGPLAFLSDRLSGVQKAVAAAKPTLQELATTTQEMDKSFLDQTTSGIEQWARNCRDSP